MKSSSHPQTSVKRPISAIESHSSDPTMALTHRAALIGQPNGPIIQMEMIRGRSDINENNDRDMESQSPTFECSHCQQSFQWKKNLYRHLKNYHGINWKDMVEEDELYDEAKPHLCNVCGQRFAIIRSLYNHRARYHDKAEKLDARKKNPDHKCDDCGLGHKTSNALRVHRQRCKSIQRPSKEEQVSDDDLAHSDLEELLQPNPPKAMHYLKKAMVGYHERIRKAIE